MNVQVTASIKPAISFCTTCVKTVTNNCYQKNSGQVNLGKQTYCGELGSLWTLIKRSAGQQKVNGKQDEMEWDSGYLS